MTITLKTAERRRAKVTMRSMIRKLTRLLALLLLVTATCYACSFGRPDIASVPDNPTFATDVKPLLADHCLLCHGYPARRNAPTNFRLDVYPETDGVPGAGSDPGRWVQSVEDDRMPPAAHWGDGVGPNGKKLLSKWLANGAPP